MQLTLNGVVKEVPRGFSWTTLFFGPLPALFRGDLKWGAIQLIVNIVVAVFTAGFGVIVTWVVFAAIYNARYEQELMAAGWSESPPPRAASRGSIGGADSGGDAIPPP